MAERARSESVRRVVEAPGHPSDGRSAGPQSHIEIGVEAVMRRYGLRDRRSARRVMDDAGGSSSAAGW